MNGTIYNPLFPHVERRFKTLRISPSLLMNLLFNPAPVPRPDGQCDIVIHKVSGLPADVVILAMQFDPISDAVWLRLWSKEFPALQECEAIPDITASVLVSSQLYRLSIVSPFSFN